MNFMTPGAVGRLEKYFDRIGDVLGSDARRGSFAHYAMGLLSDAERKSVEPIAARLCADPERADAEHQRLLHFVGNSRWNDHAVRITAAGEGIDALTARESVEAWIIDDTGWLKQGTHSVGVQRQYTGSAGKVSNCQIGVSLTIATRTEQLPIDFELYLPESWINSKARRKQARIPAEIEFQTKPQLALEMIRRALADGVPKGIVLADAAYGAGNEFRRELRQLGLRYAVAVDAKTKVQLLGKSNNVGESTGVDALATALDRQGAFRRCTWREGTKQALSARFALRRIRVAQDEEVWLMIEWRDGEPSPANYYFISLPKITSTKKLVRLVMQRWRTERAYEDLKGELGLDHYEGRSYPGWHHHVSVVLSCYAFIVAERARHFFYTPRRTPGASAQQLSARATFSRQLHHGQARRGSLYRKLATTVSCLPL